MLRRVKEYIEKNNLLQDQRPVIVGLSGGADSMCLIDILCRLGYPCIAFHCNFHLRGDESNRDEHFVSQYCEEHQIPIILKHFDTKEYAQANGISIEMAARDLRYAAFEDARQEHGAQCIAVAHHENDQAETIMLNLIRGTGIRGLRGMQPRNGYIIRPLLCVTREDIVNYATLRHLKYVEDSTNTDILIQRNYVRQQLSHLSKAQIEHFAITAERMNGYITLVEAEVQKTKEKVMINDELDIEALLSLPTPETILYELLKDYGFTETYQIFASLSGQAGKTFYSPTHIAVKDRKTLFLIPRTTTNSEFLIQNYNQLSTVNYQLSIINRPASLSEIEYPKADAWEIIVDAKVADKPLTLRHWQAGDYFYPLGLKGRKKLSDFFTDMHIPRHEKDKIWLLCSGNDIVWVVGYRIDDRFKVTKSTKRLAKIQLCNTTD